MENIKKLQERNKNHIELLPGEVFIQNYDINTFNQCQWKTKRMGKIAIDEDGNIDNRYFPIFVNKEEHDKFMENFYASPSLDSIPYRRHYAYCPHCGNEIFSDLNDFSEIGIAIRKGLFCECHV